MCACLIQISPRRPPHPVTANKSEDRDEQQEHDGTRQQLNENRWRKEDVLVCACERLCVWLNPPSLAVVVARNPPRVRRVRSWVAFQPCTAAL